LRVPSKIVPAVSDVSPRQAHAARGPAALAGPKDIPNNN
jgi:hypothetical protein